MSGDKIEFTNKIVAIHLRLGEYPNLDTELACDGNDVVLFTNLRVEARIDVEATPSEHWTTRADFRHEIRDESGKRIISPGNWKLLYHHQNNPYGPRMGYEFSQVQQKVSPGDWTITYQVIGAESGVRLIKACSFRVE